MPIFDSPSYHGYDAVDYERIDPDYGTLEDLEELLAEAHRRGIRVILDLMINHTSDRHPWFVESASGPGSAKRDWYVWRADDPGWTPALGRPRPVVWHERDGAYYYGIFWSGMPDLNSREPRGEGRDRADRRAAGWIAAWTASASTPPATWSPTDPARPQNDTARNPRAAGAPLSSFVRSRSPDGPAGRRELDRRRRASPRTTASAERVAGGDELPMLLRLPPREAILTAVRRAGRRAGRPRARAQAGRSTPPESSTAPS